MSKPQKQIRPILQLSGPYFGRLEVCEIYTLLFEEDLRAISSPIRQDCANLLIRRDALEKLRDLARWGHPSMKAPFLGTRTGFPDRHFPGQKALSQMAI